jgi:hypothetical protein
METFGTVRPQQWANINFVRERALAMSRDWDVTLASWGAAPSATETQKCERAELAVRKAIQASTKLSAMDIEVFAQGSYQNGTNVRMDSDVDICVLYKAAFFNDYQFAPTLSNGVLGYVDSQYKYPEFKNDIGVALLDYFGKQFVTRGKKAFDIHANTYRIDADVVPCMEHRLFTGDVNRCSWLSGTELHPDNGGKIINWPRQNLANGISKNANTNKQFRTVTRVLKRLRYDLMEENDAVAEKIPSYLIECLVWNVPDASLTAGTLYENVRQAIIDLWNGTATDAACNDWLEVNQRKFLFRSSQPWSRADVHTFLQSAWTHIGFK